uniref:Hexosyltransferase n=1 Tax=Phallusia mammillata TaxID=59560 RepID=A0A6F9D9Z4_9ASCI|nr:chondroitin sulfate synthase 1-like [Phallusia mammillata]
MHNPSSRNVASGKNPNVHPAIVGSSSLGRAQSFHQLCSTTSGCGENMQHAACEGSVSINVAGDLAFAAHRMNKTTMEQLPYVKRTPIKKDSRLRFCTSQIWAQGSLQNLRNSGLCAKVDRGCVLSSLMKLYRRQRQIVIPFIWGILVGITMTAVLFQQHILFRGAIPWPAEGAKSLVIKDHLNTSIHIKAHIQTRGPETVSVRAIQQHLKDTNIGQMQSLSSAETENEVRLKTRIFVGVITAEKFLGSRSVAVNNTWGTQVDKVEFFAAQGTPDKYHVPVVNLEGISDNEYPPQRKMFTMLKHMCQHHVDNYEWFIRADDDVYIRVERLRQFLTQIDGDRMIYMGQPGHGVPEVREKLGLNGHNFCMGGPGVLFNRKALEALCPHIDHCMEEVVSGEEDVELGRCVTNHLHIECTHAWETLKLFYHSYQEEYTEEKPFLGNLAENDHVSRALTLHHIKVPYIMYRVHRHYTSLLLNSTIQEMSVIGKDLDRTNVVLPLDQQRFLSMEKTLVPEFKPRRLKEVKVWQSFEVDSIYSLAPARVTQDITNDMLADLKQVGETGIDEAIGHPQQQTYTYSHVSDGYLRSDPHRGTDYFLDVYFNSKQKGTPDQIRRVRLLRPAGDLEVTGIRDHKLSQREKSAYFFVIVPVERSQSSVFESFMRNHYESTFLSPHINKKVVLVAVPYQLTNDKSGQTWASSPSAEDVVKWYKIKYPDAHILTATPQDGADISVTDNAYAKGLVVAERFLSDVGAVDAPSYAFLTSSNISLSVKVVTSCLHRTSSQTAVDSDNYNFLDYKVGKAPHTSSSLLYQPVPFRVFPSAPVMSWDNTNSANGLPQSSLTSSVGFWDQSVATGEDCNRLVAPLCGQLNQFLPSAKDAIAQQNSTVTTAVTFRDILFQRIYAGALRVFRVPDRAFVNVPRR